MAEGSDFEQQSFNGGEVNYKVNLDTSGAKMVLTQLQNQVDTLMSRMTTSVQSTTMSLPVGMAAATQTGVERAIGSSQVYVPSAQMTERMAAGIAPIERHMPIFVAPHGDYTSVQIPGQSRVNRSFYGQMTPEELYVGEVNSSLGQSGSRSTGQGLMASLPMLAGTAAWTMVGGVPGLAASWAVEKMIEPLIKPFQRAVQDHGIASQMLEQSSWRYMTPAMTGRGVGGFTGIEQESMAAVMGKQAISNRISGQEAMQDYRVMEIEGLFIGQNSSQRIAQRYKSIMDEIIGVAKDLHMKTQDALREFDTLEGGVGASAAGRARTLGARADYAGFTPAEMMSYYKLGQEMVRGTGLAPIFGQEVMGQAVVQFGQEVGIKAASNLTNYAMNSVPNLLAGLTDKDMNINGQKLAGAIAGTTSINDLQYSLRNFNEWERMKSEVMAPDVINKLGADNVQALQRQNLIQATAMTLKKYEGLMDPSDPTNVRIATTMVAGKMNPNMSPMELATWVNKTMNPPNIGAQEQRRDIMSAHDEMMRTSGYAPLMSARTGWGRFVQDTATFFGPSTIDVAMSNAQQGYAVLRTPWDVGKSKDRFYNTIDSLDKAFSLYESGKSAINSNSNFVDPAKVIAANQNLYTNVISNEVTRSYSKIQEAIGDSSVRSLEDVVDKSGVFSRLGLKTNATNMTLFRAAAEERLGISSLPETVAEQNRIYNRSSKLFSSIYEEESDINKVVRNAIFPDYSGSAILPRGRQLTPFKRAGETVSTIFDIAKMELGYAQFWRGSRYLSNIKDNIRFTEHEYNVKELRETQAVIDSNPVYTYAVSELNEYMKYAKDTGASVSDSSVNAYLTRHLKEKGFTSQGDINAATSFILNIGNGLGGTREQAYTAASNVLNAAVGGTDITKMGTLAITQGQTITGAIGDINSMADNAKGKDSDDLRKNLHSFSNALNIGKSTGLFFVENKKLKSDYMKAMGGVEGFKNSADAREAAEQGASSHARRGTMIAASFANERVANRVNSRFLPILNQNIAAGASAGQVKEALSAELGGLGLNATERASIVGYAYDFAANDPEGFMKTRGQTGRMSMSTTLMEKIAAGDEGLDASIFAALPSVAASKAGSTKGAKESMAAATSNLTSAINNSAVIWSQILDKETTILSKIMGKDTTNTNTLNRSITGTSMPSTFSASTFQGN